MFRNSVAWHLWVSVWSCPWQYIIVILSHYSRDIKTSSTRDVWIKLFKRPKTSCVQTIIAISVPTHMESVLTLFWSKWKAGGTNVHTQCSIKPHKAHHSQSWTDSLTIILLNLHSSTFLLGILFLKGYVYICSLPAISTHLLPPLCPLSLIPCPNSFLSPNSSFFSHGSLPAHHSLPT